jgi:hypothetical protein
MLHLGHFWVAEKFVVPMNYFINGMYNFIDHRRMDQHVCTTLTTQAEDAASGISAITDAANVSNNAVLITADISTIKGSLDVEATAANITMAGGSMDATVTNANNLNDTNPTINTDTSFITKDITDKIFINMTMDGLVTFPDKSTNKGNEDAAATDPNVATTMGTMDTADTNGNNLNTTNLL